MDRDTLKGQLHELQPLLVTSKQHGQAMNLAQSMGDAISTLETLVGGPSLAVSDGETT